MNKGQGFAVGAALVVALLFRPAGSSTPLGSEASETGQSTPNPSAQMPREGPWIASCNYWAPTRPFEEPSAKQPVETPATLDIKDGPFELHARLDETDERKELRCVNEPLPRWGFPAGDAPINVTAIIATVSDPVHSHLALAFDRTVDAILQAATDNYYVSSYYWLPWKNRSGLKFAEFPADKEPGHDPQRERQPGLLILKPARVPPPGTFYNVIYLFLVAETPTQGVDGFQLRNALLYEAQLKAALGKQFSTGPNGIAIIGPQYSGSAASLRSGIETARKNPTWTDTEFEVTGATSTTLPWEQLETGTQKIHFLSFAENGDYGNQTLISRLSLSGYDIASGIVFLIEDNTAFADKTAQNVEDYQVIRFPREISLLRNAQIAGQSGNAAIPSGVTFSPYLHFSLKDYGAQDSVPQFSREHTPLSQEAQLMTIARQVQRFRFQYIAITASSVLDEIFLAQFLHRACPDARLVFFGADLLMVREIDNVPFIGSITIAPYPLIGLRAGRAFPNSSSEAYYNAVSYTFWRNGLGGLPDKPILQDYHFPLDPLSKQPPLWATAVGKDGYYPLAILSPRSSSDPHILPQLESRAAQTASIVYPSQLWVVLCAFVCLLCSVHTVMLLGADYWSPVTRDLAIQDNDQPRRRSVYIHGATAMLFSMAFVVSFPVLWLARVVRIHPPSAAASVVALLVALSAVIASVWKTREYIGWTRRPAGDAYDRVRANVYLFLNLGAWTALIGVPSLWCYLCCIRSSDAAAGLDFLGLSFCYRSIHPGSGVSPVVPVLLLLFSWYLWGVFQTLRLRFSENGRPRLPKQIGDEAGPRLFVSDDDLVQCGDSRHSCLYRNITCLLITREMICRLFEFGPAVRECGGADDGGRRGRSRRIAIDVALGTLYAGALVWCSFFTRIRSLDHFLWTGKYLSCPYEFLVGLLFFPLLAVSLTGWMRMILIWGALKSGVLERLENMPIRFAFSRLKVMGWMTMLRTGGLQEQWRDMTRGLESMRQMLNRPDLREKLSDADWRRLENASKNLQEDLQQLRLRLAKRADPPVAGEHDYDFMRKIELGFAAFGEELLSTILIPYWNHERSGMVESEEICDDPDKPWRAQAAGPGSPEPARILAAEEFLAIRYISLIRCVLANLRYLMSFVSASFVLAILAWNSYPFQPSQLGDLLFTGLLAVLGSGVIWVFAQMHRNAILSRITETRANELGWDFYLRVVSFGALPVLTWLAYQFPDIGNLVYKFLQPGVPVIK